MTVKGCVEWLIDSVFMPGEETALLPCQHNVGLHRYVPVDFRGKIINLALFRATKTEGVDSYGSLEKALLNNYHLSDCLLSVTPSDSECLLTKQSLSLGLLSSLIHAHSLNKVNIHLILHTVCCLQNTAAQCHLGY